MRPTTVESSGRGPAVAAMTLEASADAKATPTSDIDAVLAMPATAALLNLASLCTASDMVMTEASAKAAEAADTTSMLSNAAGSVNNEMTLMPSGLVAVWKDASVSSKRPVMAARRARVDHFVESLALR